MITYQSIFKLGTLEVYSKQDQAIANLFQPDHTPNGSLEYFWRDAASPQGWGPFNSIWDSMEHYKQVVKAFKPGEPRHFPEADVIRVDFIRKKRVNDNLE